MNSSDYYIYNTFVASSGVAPLPSPQAAESDSSLGNLNNLQQYSPVFQGLPAPTLYMYATDPTNGIHTYQIRDPSNFQDVNTETVLEHNVPISEFITSAEYTPYQQHTVLALVKIPSAPSANTNGEPPYLVQERLNDAVLLPPTPHTSPTLNEYESDCNITESDDYSLGQDSNSSNDLLDDNDKNEMSIKTESVTEPEDYLPNLNCQSPLLADKPAEPVKRTRKRSARKKLTDNQKVAHNKIEKKYRTNINEKIFGLNDLIVASFRCKENGENGRPNKSKILEHAASYIKHLKRTVFQLREKRKSDE